MAFCPRNLQLKVKVELEVRGELDSLESGLEFRNCDALLERLGEDLNADPILSKADPDKSSILNRSKDALHVPRLESEAPDKESWDKAHYNL